MRNHAFCFTLAIAFVCSLACLAGCDDDEDPFFPSIISVKVLVEGNKAYPIYQFTCADPAAPGQDQMCPNGFGCDEQHYHGDANSIGTVPGSDFDSEVDFSIQLRMDPDQCLCGWGKVTEADTRTLVVFEDFVDTFFGEVGLVVVKGLSKADQLSIDPCFGL